MGKGKSIPVTLLSQIEGLLCGPPLSSSFVDIVRNALIFKLIFQN
jgi:hypothetical protein